MFRCRSYSTLIMFGATTLSLSPLACVGDGSTGADDTVASVVVTPAPLLLYEGQTATLSALPRNASGGTLSAHATSWSVADGSVAAVSTVGVLTAKHAGSTTVTATSDGVPGTTTVTVRQVPVASVQLVPATLTLPVSQIGQLAVTTKDSIGGLLNGRTVALTTSDAAIATVSGTGEVTALGVGSVTISATSEGWTAIATVTVVPVPVAAVAVTLGSASIAVGKSTQAVAIARDGSGNALAGRAPTFATSNANVATVSATGLVSGVSIGTASIVATVDGVQAAATVTVTRIPVASVSLTPATATILRGQTVQLAATPRDATGGILIGLDVVFSTSDASVAAVDPAGLVTGVSAGSATITATSEGRTATSAIVVTNPFSVASIVASEGHTCALTATGAAYCWGANHSGQAGDGTVANTRATPTPVVGGLQFTSLAAGGFHTCGITVDGVTYCWGANTAGQLGDGTTTQRLIPTRVSTSVVFTSLALGLTHSCGLDVAGHAYCWGDGSSGQLGVGDVTKRLVPTAVAGGVTYAMLTAGQITTCGLTGAGAAYCWGDNSRGELGDGSPTTRLIPSAVQGGLSFSSLSAGDSHSCGLTTANRAYCWGSNDVRKLGDGSTAVSRFAPSAVATAMTFNRIVAGDYSTCALDETGAAYCWGGNTSGNLGDGTATDHALAAPVLTTLRFVALTGGSAYYCARTSDGSAYCWGDNGNGSLGDGTTTRHYTPVGVLPPAPTGGSTSNSAARR
jgi:alpha-tubulin suppressor-like RCC1 family protein